MGATDIANSSADGTGTDLTGNITVDVFITYQQAAFISVSNSGATDAYLTEFNIRANPVTVYAWIKKEYEDEDSIAKYRVKDETIENDWIVSENTAQEIIESEVAQYKDSQYTYKSEIIGHPHVKAGELVTIETADQTYTSFQISNLDWSLDFDGYNQTVDLIAKSQVYESYDSFGIATGTIAEGTIGVATNSRGIVATVEAKVRIKKIGVSYTISSRVSIS